MTLKSSINDILDNLFADALSQQRSGDYSTAIQTYDTALDEIDRITLHLSEKKAYPMAERYYQSGLDVVPSDRDIAGALFLA